MNGSMPQKARGEYPLTSSTTQFPKSISGREQLDKKLNKIEEQFRDRYRKDYEKSKKGDKEIMDDWKRDIRKQAPAVDMAAVLRLEDELWNS